MTKLADIETALGAAIARGGRFKKAVEEKKRAYQAALSDPSTRPEKFRDYQDDLSRAEQTLQVTIEHQDALKLAAQEASDQEATVFNMEKWKTAAEKFDALAKEAETLEATMATAAEQQNKIITAFNDGSLLGLRMSRRVSRADRTEPIIVGDDVERWLTASSVRAGLLCFAIPNSAAIKQYRHPPSSTRLAEKAAACRREQARFAAQLPKGD